ncbi:hypothetical protein [Belnapia rosea]|uniref:hypothetical protein n=1 Tax=Belnapia rosea TaxID=938405 RepID=UPI0015A0EF93|nr:hypothetical protein [Belnapia rosea]
MPKRMFNELILEVNPTITAIGTVLIGVSLLAVGFTMVVGGQRLQSGTKVSR